MLTLCHPSHSPPTNVGPPTCAAFGLAKMAGRRWRLSWIVTLANCWVGICRAPAKQQQRVSALEHALIARFGTLGKVDEPFLLRSDNGLVFTSCAYTKLVRSYGLRQEFITPHCPQQRALCAIGPSTMASGMMEQLIWSLKEQCIHRHRFESLAYASRTIGDGLQFYNHKRPHQALAMRTPNEAFNLAA